MAAAKWYYAVGEESFGPLTFSALKELASQGTIDQSTLVCTRGSDKWVAASSVRNLFPDTSAIENDADKSNHDSDWQTSAIAIAIIAVPALLVIYGISFWLPIVWIIFTWTIWLTIMGGTGLFAYQRWLEGKGNRAAGYIKSAALLFCVFMGLKVFSIGNGTPKVNAMKAIVSHLENMPDIYATESEHKKHNGKTSQLLDAFEKIPFDPKKQRAEVKEIVKLYEDRVNRRFKGQLILELEGKVMTMFRESRYD